MTTDRESGTTSPPGSSARKRVVRAVAAVVVVVVVFGWLLPQIIDYELVWEAMTSLTWEELLLLCLLTLLRVPTEAMIYRAMLPGLRLLLGSEAYLSSNVAANVLPPPAPSVIQYSYFRADGFDGRDSMTGAVGSFVFPQAGRIVLPIVAFVVLLITGGVDTEAVVITVISVVLVVVVAVLIWFIGRGEASARWVGHHLGRFVSWLMVRFSKEPVGDLGDQVVEFRDNAFVVVRRRWAIGSIAVTLNLALTYLILVASLRFVGIEQSQLGLAAIFAAFAVAFFAGVVIPLTGSGLGVVDVVMISTLSASTTGSVDVNVIVAAVVLWRVFYSLLAFFPGIFTLTRFTKTHGDLLKAASSELGVQADVDFGET
ncbi:MAG: lysylphosphatidylglycerol synthase domain-containing protein [Acidimicrobiia bacterium]|nr:lysylphosphatidylglycerol synthase domain-containing protein [Acidimicrobiia bacterium]